MADYPVVDRIESVTIILPVMNETVSLKKTVEMIRRDAGERVLEYLIVVCERTTPEAMATVERLREDLGERVVVHHQSLPFLAEPCEKPSTSPRQPRHHDGQRLGD